MHNQDIICISSIDWDFIWQGHQEIMSSLARDGNRVLFIENTGVRPPTFKDLPRLGRRIYNWFHSVKGIRKEGENLYIYSPVILPFPYSRIARWVNRSILVSALGRWVRSVGFSNPIIWTFLPTGIVLDIIDNIDPKIVIYYCIDNFSASSPAAKKIKDTETKLLKRADLVFVTAKNLRDECAKYSPSVHIFPFGVNLDVYKKALNGKAEMPEDLAPIKRPVVGYVGGIHKWIDFELVRFLAGANPDKSFVFVGPLQADVSVLKQAENIHFLGQKKYEELPFYVANFDVCVIPYLITEYTKNVYPTKINEYLSLGKPVISTAIPEVEAFNRRNDNIIFIGKTPEDYSSLINKALAEGPAGESRDKRQEAAAGESSWKVKIAKMCALIEDKIRDKESEKALNWKNNFLKVYQKTKRGTLAAIAACLSLYLILFHTPFIWWIAAPLTVESPLKKSDCIVVLAGGVGESGKAGQGYEERVKYAAELYKKGFSNRLIFSSGYTYAFKETSVMKALAVSLGIPEDRIILEDSAKNTHENVLNTSRIMDKERFRSAIVISSPYNMRRVVMVWNKNSSDKKFIAAPVKDSLFFGDRKKTRLEHVQAIVHEYIGIIYYKSKGYI
ncbi:MAG: ElyC/SanA/YdcF family protein [Candidatus Omnitrophota bacterium]|nr:ElyC/SanA/YdcF family protein [Candidatus Omnitrophota bacterium]